MSAIGTYGSSIYPFTPLNILPQPGDVITLDWMDTISQFSQQYLKMATTIATIANAATHTFSYEALRIDQFFPILHSYYYDTGSSLFAEYNNPLSGWVRFQEIGKDSCKFVNNSGVTRSFLLIAYL